MYYNEIYAVYASHLGNSYFEFIMAMALEVRQYIS
jgi:hypothetical protein